MRISDWSSDVCSSDLAATPEGFVFTAKASRYSTTRRVLAEAGPSVEKFVTQRITRLGGRLGPIVWQFMPTKKFDATDFDAYLELLPKEPEGLTLRPAVEVRPEEGKHGGGGKRG